MSGIGQSAGQERIDMIMACTGNCVGLRNIYPPSHGDLPPANLLGVQAMYNQFPSRRAFTRNPRENRKFLVFFPSISSQAICAAGQESTTSTYSKVEAKVDSTAVEPGSEKSADATGVDKASTSATAGVASAKPSPSKPKTAAAKKAPSKPLPDLISEDAIPALKAMLEDEKDISDVELSFQNNQLEGAFIKNGVPYYFWVFFPDGTLEGSKAFSLSSYASQPSTIEPFLTTERKPTSNLLVFWIKKRLSAQKILSEIKRA